MARPLPEFAEHERVYLAADSWYVHRPGAVKVSSVVFDQLWEKRALFEPQHFRLFGRHASMPRRQGLFAATALTHRFGGTTIEALPLTEHPFLEELMTSYGRAHNAALVDWYENLKQHAAAQAHDEPTVVQAAGILCVTLGRARPFRVLERGSRSVALELTLEDGDLLLMGGEFQRRFLHEVPKRPVTVGDGRRISFTLRLVRGGPESSAAEGTLLGPTETALDEKPHKRQKVATLE